MEYNTEETYLNGKLPGEGIIPDTNADERPPELVEIEFPKLLMTRSHYMYLFGNSGKPGALERRGINYQDILNQLQMHNHNKFIV